MSQSLSRRSFLKYAGSGAVGLAAALLTGVSGAAETPCYEGEPALLDGKAAVELLGYAPAPELDSTLVYLSVENLSARPLTVGASYLQSRGLDSKNALYSLGTGLTAFCDGKQVRVGSFAAPLYGENAADASAFPQGGGPCSTASARPLRIGRQWSWCISPILPRVRPSTLWCAGMPMKSSWALCLLPLPR